MIKNRTHHFGEILCDVSDFLCILRVFNHMLNEFLAGEGMIAAFLLIEIDVTQNLRVGKTEISHC